VPVHLAVGYELILDVLIFVGLLWLARAVIRSRTGRLAFNWDPRYPRDGMLFWTYIGAYSVCRFFIQFYRVDTPFALGLSQAQLLSVLSAMVAIWALVFQYQRYRRYGPNHLPSNREVASAAVASGEPTEPNDSVDSIEPIEHAPLSS
jgi:prolipoprotein diacylglyceryltransferase